LPGKGEHGDVVVLAEGLRGNGDGFGWLAADGCGPLEAKRRSCFFTRFYHSIDEHGELLSLCQPEGGFGIGCLCGKAQRPWRPLQRLMSICSQPKSRAPDEPHNQHDHNNCSYQTQT
jgi:hypothetical protein